MDVSFVDCLNKEKILLVQMAGFPGSGKSTLAIEISKIIDAIILDVDIIKTSMMESGIQSSQIANASYHTMFSLCEYYLSQSRNVIIDSPCRYLATLDRGLNIVSRYNANYKFIECILEDFEEINKRLGTRINKLSQLNSAKKEDFKYWLENSQRPSKIKYMTVDSSKPVSSNIQEIIEYISS